MIRFDCFALLSSSEVFMALKLMKLELEIVYRHCATENLHPWYIHQRISSERILIAI